MKATQGPCMADGYYVRQKGEHGTRMIADVCYTGPHHTPPDEYPKSCRLTDEANARLIAAAPDLLESLKIAMEFLTDKQLEWAKKARAAIAKAEGGAK